MNPQLAASALPVLRIILASLSFWLAAVNLEQIEFLWALESATTKNIYVALHIAWMLNSVFLLGLGLFGPIGPILNFIFTYLSCDMNIHGTGLDIWIFETIALYSMFLPLTGRFSLDRYFSIYKPREPFGAWPLILLGINWGFIFFIGGLAKLADPLWVSGEAVYYFLSLPHITHPIANKIALSGLPLSFVNYFVIAFEVFFLFLFIFNRTRIIAVLIAIGFFAFLGFPMEMLFVAPMGLSLGVFLLAATKQFNPFKKVSTPSLPIHPVSKTFIRCTLAFMIFNLVVHSTYRYRKMLYPSIGGNLKLQQIDSNEILVGTKPRTSPLMKTPSIKKFFRLYFKHIQPVNRSTVKVEYISPFNSYHIFGFFTYRVFACTETCDEPVDIFKEDKHPGRFAGTGYSGWIYSVGYRISNHAYRHKVGEFNEINNYNQRYYLSIFNFVAHKLNKKIDDFDYFKIQVAPINLADRQKNVEHPYLTEPYGDFLIFRPISDEWDLRDDYPDFHSVVDLGEHGLLFLSTKVDKIHNEN